MKWKFYQSFFKGKKILVVGNTGFVGSYLSLTLSLMGSKVIGYSLKKKDKKYLSNTIEYKKKIKTIYDDIKNIEFHLRGIKKFKPDILIHLASQPLVSESYISTKKTYETNILGTVKLFELAKNLKSLKNILIFTSDKVYKNLEKKNLKENSPLGGDDPYSSSKSAQDIISNSYKTSFFEKKKNIFIVRAGNIIGGGDWEKTRLIPDLFISNNKKKNILLRNSNATRPWQHILDITEGILKLIQVKGKKISKKTFIYNIGPRKNKNLNVKNLIKKFISKSEILKISYNSKKIGFRESKFLNLSSDLIMRDIKWSPKLTLNDTIKLTSDWYEYFFTTRKKMLNFTEKQIKSFFNN